MKAIPGRNRFIGVVVLTMAAGMIFSCGANAASNLDLQDKINGLEAKLIIAEKALTDLSINQAKLIQRYTTTNASAGGLLVFGTGAGTKGQNIQIPISFLPGPIGISGVQQDIILPAGFTLVSITAGPAALVAGKSVSSNNGRMIIFGLNQTPIDAGVVAFATIKSPATAGGIYAINVNTPVASDGSGTPVPISVTSGWVKIQ